MARAVALFTAMVILAAVLAAARARAPAMSPAWTSAEADQQYDVGKLIGCAPAIIGGTTPSEDCCSNLKAQEGCFCQYEKDPNYSRYINNPNTRKTVESCGISVPTCPK